MILLNSCPIFIESYTDNNFANTPSIKKYFMNYHFGFDENSPKPIVIGTSNYYLGYLIDIIFPKIVYFNEIILIKEGFDNIKYNYSDYKKDFDGKYIPMRIDRESREIARKNQDLYNSYFTRSDGEIVSMEFYKDISIAYFDSSNKDSEFEIYKTSQIKEYVDKIYKYGKYRQNPILKQILISEYEYRKERSDDPEKFQLLEDKILPIIEQWEEFLEKNLGDLELVADKFRSHLESNKAKLN